MTGQEQNMLCGAPGGVRDKDAGASPGFSLSLKGALWLRKFRARYRALFLAAFVLLFLGVFAGLLAWTVVLAKSPTAHRWPSYLILSVCLGVWPTVLWMLFRLLQIESYELSKMSARDLLLRLYIDRIALSDRIYRANLRADMEQDYALIEELARLLEADFRSSEKKLSKLGDDGGQLILFESFRRLYLATRPASEQKKAQVIEGEALS